MKSTTSSSSSNEPLSPHSSTYCMNVTVSKLQTTVSPPNSQPAAPLGSINPAAVRRSFSGDAFLNPKALGVAGLQQPLDVEGGARKDAEEGDNNPMLHPQYTGCRYDRDKPAYSYASLIAQAILDTPDRKLTLNQIYHWIMNKYPYYRSQNSGWQVERQGNENGKGAYWTIQPDQLPYFQDGAFRRRRALSQECGEKRTTGRKRRRLEDFFEEPEEEERQEEGSQSSDQEEANSWVAEDYDDPNMPALEWTPINGLTYAEGVEKIVNNHVDSFGIKLGSELDWSFMTGGNILTSDLLLNIRF